MTSKEIDMFEKEILNNFMFDTLDSGHIIDGQHRMNCLKQFLKNKKKKK